MDFLRLALDFIFPPTCGICHELGEGYLCSKCEKELEKYLYQNINPGKDEMKNEKFHLLQYNDMIRQQVIAYKFQDKSYLYHLFAELILGHKEVCEFLKQYDVIIPVPIHPKRKRERGYNQSELIAREVAKKLKLELKTDILLKQIHTKPQSTLGKENRRKNVQGAYKVKNIHKIQGKKIIIFDDIYTTGATVEECKRVLLDSGVEDIGIFTIAKSIY